MTHIEQHRMILELRDVEHRMTPADLEMFSMFRKRDMDDEDLDSLSRKKLLALYDQYIVSKRPKGNPLDSLFKS